MLRSAPLRLASMFSTMRAATPRNGRTSAPAGTLTLTATSLLADATGVVDAFWMPVLAAGPIGVGDGDGEALLVGAGAGDEPPVASLNDSRSGVVGRKLSQKKSCQFLETELGSDRYRSYISSTSQSLGPYVFASSATLIDPTWLHRAKCPVQTFGCAERLTQVEPAAYSAQHPAQSRVLLGVITLHCVIASVSKDVLVLGCHFI